MQQCGVSTEGAMAFQPVLKFNTTITVLDLRLNPLIGKCELLGIFHFFEDGTWSKLHIY